MKKHIITFFIIFLSVFILSSCDEAGNCADGHNYIEEVITPSTCTEKGSVKHICSNCNYSYIETTVALGHSYVTLDAVAPTCTSSGLSAGLYCSRCNEVVLEQTVIPSNKHSYRCIDIKQPSCTEQGEKTYHCEICNDTYVSYTPAHGHTEVIDIGHGSTCSSAGLSNGSHCATCNEIINPQVTIDLAPHSWTSVILKEPTCTEVGVVQFTCNICNVIETSEIAPIGHTPVIDPMILPTCTTTGLTEGSHCAVCEEVIVAQELIEVVEHTYAKEIIVEPKCLYDGKARYECVDCGYYYEDNIEPTGHNVIIDEQIDPTCLEYGKTEGSHCDKCGVVLKAQNSIEPTGHNVIIDMEVLATCEGTGLTEGSHCAVCQEVLVAQEIIPAKGHSYMSYIIYESTCENTGREYHECYECRYAYISVIDALGHIEVIDQQILPTCTDVGYTDGSHCGRCNEIIKERTIINALGHDEVVDIGYPSTCTEEGLSDGSHCARCNNIIIDRTIIPAKGHTAIIDEAIAATCTATGLTEGKHCSICDEVIIRQEMIPALGHDRVINPSINPSCTKTGLSSGSYCDRCNLVLVAQTEIEALGHEYITIVESQATCLNNGKVNHKCARCDDSYTEIISALGHDIVLDSRIEPTCDTTGLTEGNHCSRCDYFGIKQELIPAKGHNYASSVQVEATCISTGVMLYTCKTCNHSYNEMIPLKEHTIVIDEAILPTCTEYGKTEGSHCSVCHKIIIQQDNVEMAAHTYISNITLEPTCTSTGIVEYTCSVCGDEKNSQLDALGHLEVVIEGIIPTCSSVGKSDGIKCGRCNIIILEQVDLQVAHDYEAIEFTEATCLTIGNYKYKCKYCDDTYTEAVDALGHNYVPTGMINPTCTHTGLTEGVKCSRCNEVKKAQEMIPALGHDVEILKAVAATCTTTGLTQGMNCLRCNMIVVAQKVVAALGHDIVIDEAVAATCISTGLTEGSHCGRCSEVLHQQTIIGLIAHEIVTDYAVAATCTQSGLTSGTHCSYCQEVFIEQEKISPTGHTYTGISIQDATCTEGGRMYYYCASCYDSFEQDTQPLNHNFTMDYYLAPTCTHTGLTEGSHCSRCDYVFVEQVMIPALGHKYTTTVVTEPTCTEDGQNCMTCTVCSDYYYKTTNKKGHVEVIDPLVEPTCSKPGLKEGSHCSRCSIVLKVQAEIPAIGHDYIETITTLPTCTEEGRNDYQCSRCTSHYFLSSEKLGHNAVTLEGYPSTCILEGKSDGTICSRCNEILVEQEILAKSAHKFIITERVQYSCTTGGINHHECSVCGYSYDVNIPSGHYFEYGICIGCNLVDEAVFNSTYGYETLASWSNGDDLQAFYRDIHNACKDVFQNYTKTYNRYIDTELYYTKYNLTTDQALYVWRTYRGDNALWYWFKCSYSLGGVSNKYIKIVIDSKFATGEVRKTYTNLFIDFIRNTVPYVKDETAYNKALYFHDVIINRINYKYDENGNPDNSVNAHSIAGVLDGTGVVCEGYAWMFDLLLEASGVECVYARGDGHAFNVVKMDDGLWYWFDPTWDDMPEWELGIKYNYFCVNDVDNVRWWGYSYATATANFLVGHTPYQCETMTSSAGYYIPQRATTNFTTSKHALINEIFTVGQNTYTVFGYDQVMLCNSTQTGSISVASTVTYKGRSYKVVAIGGVSSYSGRHYQNTVFAEGATNITIPSTVEYIIDNAFNVSSLRNIYVNSNNPYFTSIDGVLFTKNKFTLIKYPSAKTVSSYTIPDEVVDVAYQSFLDCNSLTTIIAGANTTNYGSTNLGYNYRYDTEQTYRSYSYKSYLSSNYTLVE